MVFIVKGYFAWQSFLFDSSSLGCQGGLFYSSLGTYTRLLPITFCLFVVRGDRVLETGDRIALNSRFPYCGLE